MSASQTSQSNCQLPSSFSRPPSEPSFFFFFPHHPACRIFSSPIRDQTRAPSSGSTVSPLDHTGEVLKSHLSKVPLVTCYASFPHSKTSMAPLSASWKKGHAPSHHPRSPRSRASHLPQPFIPLLVTQICSTPSLSSLPSAHGTLVPLSVYNSAHIRSLQEDSPNHPMPLSS